MNSHQLKQKRIALSKSLEDTVMQINQLPNGHCIDCKHYDRKICNKFEQEPPANFVESGECDEWVFDEYPSVLGELKAKDFV